MKKLFGTDGIRGVAGHPPLTLDDARRIGQAAGLVLRKHYKTGPIRVLIVRDTRASGPKLASRLSDGLRKEGIDVFDAGVLCTPSVACLVRLHRFQCGVVISASHNPPEFNGIKFFTNQGRKWPDAWEHAVESILAKPKKEKVSKKTIGMWVQADELAADYEEFLLSTLPTGLDLKGIKIGVDCSNGANFSVAPRVLRRLGAKLFIVGDKPNGRNINVRCGSQSTKALANLVRSKRCQLGIAFDGDGDRVIFVNEKGQEVDGDFIIGLLAKHMKSKNKLKNRRAVITVMSNLGLRLGLNKLGVKSIETPVGDRYVSEAMKKHRSNLGGEQSGHIILGNYLPSGDGLLTALHVLSIVSETKKPFSKLVSWMKKFPQTLVNVPVKEKKPINQLNGFQTEVKRIEKKLGKKGRVLIRYSGTEPLLRIMIEGPTKKQIEGFAKNLVKEVKKSI